VGKIVKRHDKDHLDTTRIFLSGQPVVVESSKVKVDMVRRNFKESRIRVYSSIEMPNMAVLPDPQVPLP